MPELPSATQDAAAGLEGNAAALPRENVAAHTLKVKLLREACQRLRREQPGRMLRILDIGCGSGYAVTRFLGCPHDAVLGIDLYAPNVAYAQQHYARPGLRFECRSAESLVGEAAAYDVIVLADVLEHLADPAEVLRTCASLLVPGGLLLLTVPNGFGPFEIESAFARIPVLGPLVLTATAYLVAVLNKWGPLRGRWSEALAGQPADLPYNADSGHVQFFSRARLQALLTGAGFVPTRAMNLCFVAGPFTNFLFGFSERFCHWNATVAARMPAALTSAWFFECLRRAPAA